MHRLFCFLFVFFALVPLWGNEVLVIRNVNVVPMDEERVLPAATVIIENGRIREVIEEPGGMPAPDGQTVDGTGKYLMPGLAEMHAHVPGSGEEEQYRHDVLFLYLANGVTLIRGMLGDPVHLELREQLSRGEILGPRLITAGPAFSNRTAPTPERAAELVNEQEEAGYDFIKIASGTRPAFDAMADAARARGFTFSGHVPGEVGVPRALEAGYASIDHLDGYMETLVDPEQTAEVDGGFFGYRLAPHAEEERMRAIARRTREAGVWNVPTETLMYAVLVWDLETIRQERPEFRYMPPRIVDGWIQNVRQRRADPLYNLGTAEQFVRVRGQLIRALHEAGAGLLLGSDAPQFFNVPGFSLHHEMRIMTEAGLSPFEVLQTGTVKPAVFFGEENDDGRIAPGMRADLILLDANPLEDIAHLRQVAGVIRSGQWLPQDEIERRLEEIAERHQP
jgi:imidazolonepropionase-like amidohydrolase